MYVRMSFFLSIYPFLYIHPSIYIHICIFFDRKHNASQWIWKNVFRALIALCCNAPFDNLIQHCTYNLWWWAPGLTFTCWMSCGVAQQSEALTSLHSTKYLWCPLIFFRMTLQCRENTSKCVVTCWKYFTAKHIWFWHE